MTTAHSGWWVQKCFREVIFSFLLTVYVQNSKGCFSFYEEYKPATVSFACLSKWKCNSMKLLLFSYIQSHLTNHPNCQINHCIINVSCVMSLKKWMYQKSLNYSGLLFITSIVCNRFQAISKYESKAVLGKSTQQILCIWTMHFNIYI